MTRTGAAATLAAAGIGADAADALLNVAEHYGEVSILRIDPPADVSVKCESTRVGPWFTVRVES